MNKDGFCSLFIAQLHKIYARLSLVKLIEEFRYFFTAFHGHINRV